SWPGGCRKPRAGRSRRWPVSSRKRPPSTGRQPRSASPTACAGSRLSGEVLARGAGEVAGEVVVPVAGVHRAGRLEHQDRATGRGGLVLGAPGDDEDVAGVQLNGALLAAGVTKGDVETPVDHQEELVGVIVDMPDVVAAGVR